MLLSCMCIKALADGVCEQLDRQDLGASQDKLYRIDENASNPLVAQIHAKAPY